MGVFFLGCGHFTYRDCLRKHTPGTRTCVYVWMFGLICSTCWCACLCTCVCVRVCLSGFLLCGAAGSPSEGKIPFSQRSSILHEPIPRRQCSACPPDSQAEA